MVLLCYALWLVKQISRHFLVYFVFLFIVLSAFVVIGQDLLLYLVLRHSSENRSILPSYLLSSTSFLELVAPVFLRILKYSAFGIVQCLIWSYFCDTQLKIAPLNEGRYFAFISISIIVNTFYLIHIPDVKNAFTIVSPKRLWLCQAHSWDQKFQWISVLEKFPSLLHWKKS